MPLDFLNRLIKNSDGILVSMSSSRLLIDGCLKIFTFTKLYLRFFRLTKSGYLLYFPNHAFTVGDFCQWRLGQMDHAHFTLDQRSETLGRKSFCCSKFNKT